MAKILLEKSEEKHSIQINGEFTEIMTLLTEAAAQVISMSPDPESGHSAFIGSLDFALNLEKEKENG
ncbi:MAG: hypothetical protein ACK5MN_11760 [Lachnospiraceae bacterium]